MCLNIIIKIHELFPGNFGENVKKKSYNFKERTIHQIHPFVQVHVKG